MVQQSHNQAEPQQDKNAYEDASRSTAEFIQNIEPLKAHKQKTRKRRYIFIILIVLAAIGAGGYVLYSRQTTEKKPPAQTSQPQKDSETESANGLKRFSSTDLNLSFEYPSDWKVHDEQGMVKAESPIVKLPDQAGQEVAAKVVLSVVPKSSDMKDFPADQATGVRESEKFKYDSPAETQRQETFLSFMNLSGASDGLNAIYITGDSSYVKGDPIPKANFDKVEPVIWLEFVACPSQTCGDEKVTIGIDAWGNNETLKTALAILKSFNIK